MQILINHVGYEARGPKKAVLKASRSELEAAGPRPDGRAHPVGPLAFRLVDALTGEPALEGRAVFVGGVPRWRDWIFWTLDFSELRKPGRYLIELLSQPGGGLRSQRFEVGERLLLSQTAPAVLQYLRSQRCSGACDQADRRVGFFGSRRDRVDVHGGWYDASGDQSKYLSHLSYTNFLNPQQSPLVVWSCLAARDLLAGAEPAFGVVRRRLLEEALYGAEFLCRMLDPAGYFYVGVFDQWSHDPRQRAISSFRGQKGLRGEDYQAAYRQGGGLAIAALARAAGSASGASLLPAAVRGFEHLEAHNREYLADGEENILDDYCALLAAAELAAAAGGERYLQAARLRARSLRRRLLRGRGGAGFWRADHGGGGPTRWAGSRAAPADSPAKAARRPAAPARPFFHPAEAGLPAIALLRYAEVEGDPRRAGAAVQSALRSLDFELAVTAEAANPFGYARQHVQPAGGPARTAFFFPHRNESGYWWQGENARLASLAAAAGLARRCRPVEGEVEARRRERLARFAADQLDWILGCNPFDVCMLHGFGRGNPEYEAGFPNAFGGICNGITGGFQEEEGIDFLPSPQAERGEHRWRWSEQWIPHAAWYLLAVCSASAAGLAGDPALHS